MSTQYENQAWLDNWLRLKAKAEQKDFNNLVSVKEKVRTIAFIQQKRKGKIIIEDYPELTQLNLSNNELEEIIIRNCPDLKLVSLGHNKLTKLTIENCPSIQEIYTHNNKLTNWEVDVEDLKSKNLRTISYSANPLTSEEKTRLDALGLPNTAQKSRFNGKAKDYLNNKYPLAIRASIEKLDISELGLSGGLNLTGFTNLKYLNCSGNDLIFLNLIDSTQLERLDCSNNQLTDLDVRENKNLQELYANNNQLTDLDVRNLANLHTLILTQNKLDELELSDLTNLKYLNCGLNKLDELELTNNLKLKNLYCYGNKIRELKIKHLSELENLYCYHNLLENLICTNLKKLKELYCAHNSEAILLQENDDILNICLKKIDVKGCDSLEILDCAENIGICDLILIDLPKLHFVSCKENSLKKLQLKNCPKLEYLDFSIQTRYFLKKLGGRKRIMKKFVDTNLDIDSYDNLKEIFYSKNAIVSDWKNCPKLEILGIGEEVIAKDENGNDKSYYKVKEINVLAIRNTEKIQNILANSNDYSSDDLFNLEKEDLYGIPNDLRQQLIQLGFKKIKDKFTDEWYGTGEEESNPSSEEENIEDDELPVDTPLSTPPSEDEDEEETPSKQKKPDFEKLYYELLARVEKGEITLKNQELITNSNLSEDKKRELYRIITKNQEINQGGQPTTNYLPWIIGSLGIILVIGVFGYLFSKKKKNNNSLT